MTNSMPLSNTIETTSITQLKSSTMDAGSVKHVAVAQPNGTPSIAHAFDSIEDSVAAFGRGEFVIVLDDTSRENEGDLILAAESATPAQIAFLIRYSSGYLCAPITPERADALDLPLMVPNTEDPLRTAYTISVDASTEGVTTGISAYDRAVTVRALADPSVTPAGFRRPGHILPLRARAGGVRERRGHTEAAIDLCRLAGKKEAAVIGEMVIDGEIEEGKAELSGSGMMRRDECLAFGRKWGIKVCTIEDLVEYLHRTQA